MDKLILRKAKQQAINQKYDFLRPLTP